MPRRKKTTGSTPATLDVLSFLPSDRRAALEGEIVTASLRDALSSAASVAALVDSLTKHALWSHIGQLQVSALSVSGNGKAPALVPASAAVATKGKPGRPKKAAPTVAASAAPTKATAAPPSKVSGGRAKAGALADNVRACIAANPGIRTEGLFKLLGGNKKKMKAVLKSLRDSGAVTTEGKKRGTAYTLAGGHAPAARNEVVAAAPVKKKPGRPRKDAQATAAAPVAAPKAKAAKKVGKSKRRVRRTPEQIAATTETVFTFIGGNPGLNAEAIVKGVGGDRTEISDALTRLRADKRVKTTGERNFMTYQSA